MNASELIFVGIDVSKDSLEWAMDDKGKTLYLDHDEKGIAELLALILAAEVRVGAVVLEATGGFERLCIATDYGKLCAGKRADVRWQVAARIPYFA